MSLKLDLSDLSKLSEDELRYALDRYLITGEQYAENSDEAPSLEDVAPGEFDPDGKKVPQVVKYLEGASDEEFARVIAAERAGQGRKTILDMAE